MGITPGIPRGGVTFDQLNVALAPYLTAAIAASTYVPRTGGTMTGNLVVPDLVIGGVDGPRLTRSGTTIRARSNDGLIDAPFSAGALTVNGNVSLTGQTTITPTSGFLSFSSPFAFTTSLISNQAGQHATLRLQTAEGRQAGIRHFDQTNAKGRLLELYAQFPVDFSINMNESERMRINSSTGLTTFSGNITTPVNSNITAGQFRVNGDSTTVFPMGWGFRFGGLSAYVNSINIIDLTSSLATINGSITASGAIAASSDQDSRHVFGRAVIQSFVTDNVYVSHFDHMSATNYALRQQPAGGTVLNSASGQLLQFAVGNVTTASMNDTQFVIGNNPALHGSLFGFDGSATTIPVNGGRGLSIFGRHNITGAVHVAIGGIAQTATSGSQTGLFVGNAFSPTSGVGNYTALRCAPTINQTGGSTGITRAFFADSGIVSAFDYRAFDCSNSVGFAYHSSGTAPSRLGGSLTVVGNLGFATARVEQPLSQSMALRTFESSLSAWQEPWIGRATPTGPVIGFLGASPIGRQTLPAAASDPATTQALANALRQLLINFGLAN